MSAKLPVLELKTDDPSPSVPVGAARLAADIFASHQRIIRGLLPVADLSRRVAEQWRPLLDTQALAAQALEQQRLLLDGIQSRVDRLSLSLDIPTVLTGFVARTRELFQPALLNFNAALVTEAAQALVLTSRALDRALAPLRDPRLWRRLRLRLMLRAIQEGDPEELALVFRSLGIPSPQPEHVEALWTVLRRPGVWRVIERHEPEPYLRKAVWNEAERLLRRRRQADARLWFPSAGAEVLSLDAPSPDGDGDAIPLDAIPAHTPDPLAWLERAEGERHGRQLIRRIAGQLSREQRMLLLLVVEAGHDYREAARVVFPGLEGWQADNKWKAVKKRAANILAGKSRSRRHL